MPGDMNLITTVIGFGMSATFIIFVCMRLICGRIRSPPESTETFGSEMRSDLDMREHVNGLAPVVVSAFPTVKFNSEAFSSREDAQCSICLGEYEEKETLRILPMCGHNFHVACIDTWLQKQSTCPVCRLSLHDPVNVKYVISPRFSTTHRLVDSPGVGSDHSYQWLIPSHERSVGNASNQRPHISIPINLEPTNAGEAGSRR